MSYVLRGRSMSEALSGGRGMGLVAPHVVKMAVAAKAAEKPIYKKPIFWIGAALLGIIGWRVLRKRGKSPLGA